MAMNSNSNLASATIVTKKIFSNASDFSDVLRDVAERNYALHPELSKIFSHFQESTIDTMDEVSRYPYGTVGLERKRQTKKEHQFQIIDAAMQETTQTNPPPSNLELSKLRTQARHDKLQSLQHIDRELTVERNQFNTDVRKAIANILEERLDPALKLDLHSQNAFKTAYQEYDIAVILHLIQTITGNSFDINQRVLSYINDFTKIQQTGALSEVLTSMRHQLQRIKSTGHILEPGQSSAISNHIFSAIKDDYHFLTTQWKHQLVPQLTAGTAGTPEVILNSLETVGQQILLEQQLNSTLTSGTQIRTRQMSTTSNPTNKKQKLDTNTTNWLKPCKDCGNHPTHKNLNLVCIPISAKICTNCKQPSHILKNCPFLTNISNDKYEETLTKLARNHTKQFKQYLKESSSNFPNSTSSANTSSSDFQYSGNLTRGRGGRGGRRGRGRFGRGFVSQYNNSANNIDSSSSVQLNHIGTTSSASGQSIVLPGPSTPNTNGYPNTDFNPQDDKTLNWDWPK